MKSKKTNENKLKIRRIDDHYRFALDFFWEKGAEFFESIKYDPNDNEVKIFRVGFVGFGEYAYEFLKVLCCLGQLPRCRLIIYIFDKKANEKKDKFQKELLDHSAITHEKVANSVYEENNGQRVIRETPDLNNPFYHDNPFYEIHFINMDVEKNEFLNNCLIKEETKSRIGNEITTKYKPFTHMFFMLGSDALNINVASNVSTEYARHNQDVKLYAMVRNDDTTAQLKRAGGVFKETYKNIELIGANSVRYSYKNVNEEEIEKLGISIHRTFSLNKAIADSCKELNGITEMLSTENENAKISRERKEIINKGIIDACNLLKNETLKLWQQHSKLRSINENYIKELGILGEELSKFSFETKLDEMVAKGECTKNEKEEILCDYRKKSVTLRLQKRFTEKLSIINNDTLLEKDFNKKEYYRRSSKSRALFEKLLQDLNYITQKKDGNLDPNNVVAEYKVTKEFWDLPNLQERGASENYSPKNIPFYRANKNDSRIPNIYLENAEKEGFITRHINVQWFEVNNILQKRWMVFRWSEGFITEDKDLDHDKNLKAKAHKFLLSYVNIYTDDEMRIRHTIDVIPLEKDEKGRIQFH